MGTRFKEIRGRWADVFALGLVGCSTFILMSPALPSCNTVSLALDWAWAPGFFVFAALCYSFAKDRLVGWTGLRHLFSYPPPWIAALIGIFLFFLYAYSFPTTMEKLGCAPIELEAVRSLLPQKISQVHMLLPILLLTAVVAWGAANWAGIHSDRAKFSLKEKEYRGLNSLKPLTMGVIAGDFEKLTRWVSDDQPVSHPVLDAFGRNVIAERIASVLSSTENSYQAIALVGEPGSGKSTILNFATYHLMKSGKIGSEVEIIAVSLWPFDSVEAAVRGILTPLSAGLARHVNISPIAGLPDDYVNAIENTGQGWARLLRSSQNPSAILASYDKVATAIGIRIVLWIEDIERFAGTAVNTDTPEVERLEPIRSLLNLLSDFKSLRIVLASASLSARFDIEKFARVVEGVPPPSTSSVWKVLHSFRKGHLLHANNDIIDPAPSQFRNQLDELGGEVDSFISELLGVMMPAAALAILCGNPRRLKYGLRYSQEAWIRLRGEIDFDDVLVISALRAAEPDVFSLINDFIDELRTGWSTNENNTENSPAFARKLDALLAKKTIPRQKAIEAIVDFVFPDWRTDKAERPSVRKPQGLASRTHRDYWGRYLSPSVIPELEKDQRVLKAIHGWKEKRSEDLVEMLVTQDQRSSIVEFSRFRLTREDLLPLLKDTVTFERTRRPKERNGQCPESVRSIWAMMFQQHPTEEKLVDALKNLLAETIPSNLDLAYSLEDCFSTVANQQALLGREGALEVRGEFERILLESFVSSGATKIIDSIKGGEPHLTYYSSWGPERVRGPKKNGLPFDRWLEFSRVLLDAVALAPDLMLPQVVPFLVSQGREMYFDGHQSLERTVFSFNEGADGLFDLDRLAVLVRKESHFKHPDQWVQQAYHAVCEKLSQRLPPSPSPQPNPSAGKKNPSAGGRKNSKAKK